MKKIDFSSDTTTYVIGFLSIVGIYAWKYESLTPGWRFLGMVLLSLVVGVTVQLLLIAFNAWRSARVDKKRASYMCRSIGVQEESTDTDDAAKCWRYMISRYSNDLLANRLSDFIGMLVTPLSTIIGVGISIWYFGLIAYLVWYGDYGEPYLLFLPLFFRMVAIVFELFIGFACNMLFNRYPGEAKRFNKNYDELRKIDPLLASKEFRDSIRG